MTRPAPDARDMSAIRSAVGQLVESDRIDDWVSTASDRALIQLMAPLEMLSFQYYLDPPSDKYLLRAARVTCEAMQDAIDECPADLASALRRLSAVVSDVGS